jgi:hypothetical protein
MPNLISGSDRPIFIVGCPRSGTTLLQLMLHSHRRIAIPAETRFVLPAYWRRRDFGDLNDAQNRRILAKWIVGRKGSRFADLGLDPQAVATEIAAGPPTLGSAVEIVFRAYARRFGKPRWGDKRPGYLVHLDVLLRMWPNAQFVHLIRDGRDCVASLQEMPWYRPDIYHAICTWREAIDYGRRYARRLGPGSFYQLQYERLVADPAGELAKLCGFLGEDYDAAMAAPQDIAERTVPAWKKWHTDTRAAIRSSRVGSWTHRLQPWEIGLAEAALGSRLTDIGYELSGAPRPSARHLTRLTQVAVHRRLAQRKRRLRDRWEQHREPGPVVSWLTPPASTAPRTPDRAPLLAGPIRAALPVRCAG